jgi:hypothetical protein
MYEASLVLSLCHPNACTPMNPKAKIDIQTRALEYTNVVPNTFLLVLRYTLCDPSNIPYLLGGVSVSP